MIFRINTQIGRRTSVVMALVPFIVCIGAYILTAHLRHKENPKDKVVPTITEMSDGFKRVALEKDRKGEYRLLIDTVASTRRFLIGVVLVCGGVIVGLHMGLFPFFETLLLRFALLFDKIPALALLPILFIVFGLGETSKVALIVIGVLPTITLDTYLRAKSIQQEQIIKGFTLGASDVEIAYRVVLPQIFPQVLDTIRLNFKAVMLFLIAGESIAATAGLGYRIFLVRRYIAMDIIIPYVIRMSVLLFLADWLVSRWIKWRYPWLNRQ